MNPNAEDRRPPLTPQLALRVAIAASVALALFAIVFFRLWFLQVLSGDQYLAQARGNPARTIDVAAPRGEIVDRSGNVLVDSKPANAVEISPADLPVALAADADGPPAASRHGPLQPPGESAGDVEQAQEVRDRRVRGPAAVADRLCRRPGLRAALLPGRDDQDRRLQGRAVLPCRAPAAVPRRQRPAGVAAPLPAGNARRAAVRDGGEDHPAGGPRVPVPRRFAERGRRSVGAGVVLRPLPARPGRRRTGPGRRPRPLHRRPVGA